MKFIKNRFHFVACFILLIMTSCNIEPYEGDIPEESNAPATCEEALQNTLEATNNIGSVSPTDSNYAELCSAYKKALQDQINLCGDEEGLIQTVINSIGDCGEDMSSGGNDEDGNYWPMSIDNSWTYTAKISGLPDSDSTMKITDLVDYQDTPSYFYENFFGSVQGTDGTGLENLQIDYYTRKSDGDYQLLVGELTAELAGLYRVTQSGYDYIILKDYLDVGNTWNYNFDVTTSYEPLVAGGADIPDLISKYDLKFEILEKDATVVSAGTTYTSVIKVKFIQTVSLVGLSASSSTAEYIYSFAKDVGIVKIEGTVYDADDNITSDILQELTSYTIN